jgi:general stress protein 26
MKFGKLDTVSVISGQFSGHSGQITGWSMVHRNGKADAPEYKVSFRDLKTTEEIKEDNLTLVEKYDEEKVEVELKAKILREKAEKDRIAEEKMEAALRKKIEQELDLRDKIESERAAAKAAVSNNS